MGFSWHLEQKTRSVVASIALSVNVMNRSNYLLMASKSVNAGQTC